MITVTVMALAPVATVEVAPDDTMQSAVQRAVEAARTVFQGDVQLRQVLYSSSSDSVPNWQAENRRVGTQPITVLVQPPSGIVDMLQSLTKELQEVRKQNALRDEVRFRNACAKLLRIACGAETFYCSSSTRFSSLGISNVKIQELATRMGVTPHKLVEQADAVIDRQNEAAHAGSLKDLLVEVETLVALITPEHENLYNWECRFLKHHKDLQTVFKDRFPTT